MHILPSNPNVARRYGLPLAFIAAAVGGAATGCSTANNHPGPAQTSASAEASQPVAGSDDPVCNGIKASADGMTAHQEDFSLDVPETMSGGTWDVSSATYTFGDGHKDTNGGLNYESHQYATAGTYPVSVDLNVEYSGDKGSKPVPCPPITVTVQ